MNDVKPSKTNEFRNVRPAIMVVDDSPANAYLLQSILKAEGYEVALAEDGRKALAALDECHPDLILLDVMMPHMDGFETCERIKRNPATRDIPIIFLTACNEREHIARGFAVGAVDYIINPFHQEELLARVRTHVRLRQTEQKLRRRLESMARTRRLIRIAAGIDDIVARSAPMRAVVEKAMLYHTASDVTVLIEGETGTGKEIIARLIHYGNGGVDAPLVEVNVPAIPETLFESELFGYAPGAFTGAAAKGRAGKLEVAGEGTLFMDEVGELPLALQPKLLRALQERMFTRLGGNAPHAFKGRVICATNRHLADMVKTGHFRADLFHRLNVGYLRIPPLRERVDEIEPLALLFLNRIARARNEAPKNLSPEAVARLNAHPWPGNVRELRNIIERACALTMGDTLAADDLFDAHPPAGNCPPPAAAAQSAQPFPIPIDAQAFEGFPLPEEGLDLEALADRIILKVMEKFNGNKTRAGEYLGLSRHALSRRLDKIRAQKSSG